MVSPLAPRSLFVSNGGSSNSSSNSSTINNTRTLPLCPGFGKMRRLPLKVLVGILLVTLIWFLLMVTYLDDLQVRGGQGKNRPPRSPPKVWHKLQVPAFSEAQALVFHAEGDVAGEIERNDGDLRLLIEARRDMERMEQEMAEKSLRLAVADEREVFAAARGNKEFVEADLFGRHTFGGRASVVYVTNSPPNFTNLLSDRTLEGRAPAVAVATFEPAARPRKKAGRKKARATMGRKKTKGKGKGKGKAKRVRIKQKTPPSRNSSSDTAQQQPQQQPQQQQQPKQEQQQQLQQQHQTSYVHVNHVESSTTAYVRLSHQLQNEIAVALRMGGLGSNIKRDYVRLHSQKPIPARSSRSRSRDERLDAKNAYRRHSFNVTASEEFPLNRRVPDYRPARCPKSLHALLPSATVIICFHNEAWSTLLRTIFSVLDRTPKHLLKEIVLVDDASTYDYLAIPLEKYLTDLSNKLLLVRTKQRQGLIRARLLGISYARGDVLVFLDSHCECADGWVEPLLRSIKYDRKKVVCPMIDIIQHDTFEYVLAPQDVHGGFEWDMTFLWKDLPQHEMDRRKDESESLRTPTMIGGIFAIDRSYFDEIGQYDEGMEIWGGENLELSFRVWQCGGSIEILPCSRVGHVFRNVIPYGFPKGARHTLLQNSMRVAEVWLDDFINFYYASTNVTRDMSLVRSVNERKKLRSSLQCKTFAWYLKYVVPEMTIPSFKAEYFGQVKSAAKNLCLETHGISVTANPCIAQSHNQIFTLTPGGAMKHGTRCLTPEGGTQSSLKLATCDEIGVKWTMVLEARQLRITNTTHSLCVAMDAGQLELIPCATNTGCRSPTTHPKPQCTHPQAWTFTHHFDQVKLHAAYNISL